MSTKSAIILSLVFAGAALAADTTSAPVAFNWFEYTGRDTVFEPPLPAGHFRNPILAGFYPDPSICRVGDDYYLINSSFAYFPGIPIFHSRDLVNWTQLGHAIDRPEQLNYDGLGVSRAIFAPAISHHDGVFYVVCTMVDAGGNFLVTATNPAGPWSDPVWFDFEGIDPSLFFDDDGRAWMVNNGAPEGTPLYQGHRAIWVQEFDIAARKLIGPRRVIVNGGVDLAKKPVWIEGPHLYKRGEWYYLCCAEGGTGDNHSQVILRSDSPTGTFVPWSGNPILTQRDLDGTVPGAVTTTGHADLVIGPNGNWWSVFLGCRPFDGRFYATGRETFLLPVTWTADGWPRILPAGQRVPNVVPAPNGGTRVDEGKSVPLTGNFTWRDEFGEPNLSRLWIMLRRPHEIWWKLSADGQALLLTPRADALSGRGNPSYLGRRVQHARFDAIVRLESPRTDHVLAGLAILQNESHHFYFGVRRIGGDLEVFVERHAGEVKDVPAQKTIPSAPAIELRLTARDSRVSFAWSIDGKSWQELAHDVDATILTTQAAGGFVGATVGVHTRLVP